ncbi:curlin [Henriciella mobilis]|uniref:CsgG/HfaB family protein n=1 Tax=Henriciella mobilis TaxID=2305467 RepID=UPI000E676180|nr:CsgG/HfaB family protein [Henriciella mobilis]RIJ15694.1 curlin [Henriciella mobilis]RIJ19158.1 curlin [Henriciella mobilis]
MLNVLKLPAAIAAATAFASACTTTSGAMLDLADKPAVSETVTETQSSLRSLPPPRERAAVAVYDFQDQTGQFKPSSAGVQTLSKAVTQGSTSVLLKALQDAGNRSWFTVIERENLDNLLKERQIIREMRRQYLGEEDVNEAALPPLLFAGIILEGGIIGYDTNTITGGAGARFLGIGAKTDYREDKVTVYLRAVSVKTGEVITTVVASKKIASVGVASNVFRFVSFKELLEVDTGITTNEPDLLALRQATEKAVELLIMEGADLGVWSFRDQVAGAELLERYRAERNGVYNDVGSAYAAAERPVQEARLAQPEITENKPESAPAKDERPAEVSMNSVPSADGKMQPAKVSYNAEADAHAVAKAPEHVAQTISAASAAVQPVAQGDGELGLTAADTYTSAIGGLQALRGHKNSIATLDMQRVSQDAPRTAGMATNMEGA